MRTIRGIIIGLLSGSVAVLVVWFTRVMQPPPDRILPDVIRLDTLEEYARNSSRKSAIEQEEEAILSRAVDAFVITNTPLSEALARLADTTGVNIVVAWDHLDVIGDQYRPERLVSVSVRATTIGGVLGALLDPLEDSDETRPVWFVRDRVVHVTSSYRRPEMRATVRVYDVRDLMFTAAPFASSFPPTTRPAKNIGTYDSLMQGSEQDIADRLIGALAAEEVSYDGEIESAHYFAGRILFKATPEGHRRIERRLEQLRETK